MGGYNQIFLVIVVLVLIAAKRKCDTNVFKDTKRIFELKYGKDRMLKELANFNCVAYEKGILKPLYARKDTVFLSNQFNPGSGTIYSMVWNRRDTISYINGSGNGFNPTIVNDRVYNNKFFRVISDWNDSTLAFYSSSHGAIDAGLIYVSRIIFRAESTAIDCCEVPEMFEWIDVQ
jgi:hypothetical protein